MEIVGHPASVNTPIDHLRVLIVGVDSPTRPNLTEPFALARLAGDLRAHGGSDVVVRTMHGVGWQDIEAAVGSIASFAPHLLGLSLPHGSRPVFDELLERLLSSTQDIGAPLVVVGNIIPTLLGGRMLEGPATDIVVARYEGEHVLRGLVGYLRGTCKIDDVPNIVFRRGSRTIATQVRTIRELDELGPPSNLFLDASLFAGAMIPVEESRGCPWSGCSFCTRLFKGHRTFSVARFIDQIRAIVERRAEIRQGGRLGAGPSIPLGIVSENFVGQASLGRTFELADALQRLQVELVRDGVMSDDDYFDIYASIRSNAVYSVNDDPKTRVRRTAALAEMVKAGLSKVFLGVESASPSQLLRYNKGIVVEEAEASIRIVRSLGVTVEIGMIIFDPLVSLNELAETVAFIKRNDIGNEITRLAQELSVYIENPIVKVIQRAERSLGRPLLGDWDPDTLRYPIIDYADPMAKIVRDALLGLHSTYAVFFESLKAYRRNYLPTYESSCTSGLNGPTMRDGSFHEAVLDGYRRINKVELDFTERVIEDCMSIGASRVKARVSRIQQDAMKAITSEASSLASNHGRLSPDAAALRELALDIR